VNLKTTPQFAFRPTRITLKILFAKCTTAVAAIATGIGKNKANAGINIVPRPKPENRVSAETTNAVIDTVTYSIKFSPLPTR